MKKRMLSLLLALTMIVGMLPLSALTVTAASAKHYEVDNWGELKNVLEWDSGSTPVTITLTADMNCGHEKDSDGHQTVQIIGNKTLDLNGYTVRCDDKSNYRTIPDDSNNSCDGYYNGGVDRVLFDIVSGASLTLNDSSHGSGSIQYDAYIIGYTTGGFRYMDWNGKAIAPGYGEYTHRDIFDVHGTLTINDGRIEGGRSKRQWHSVANHHDANGNYLGAWVGYAYQQIWSQAAIVYDGGKLTVNGGYVQGRGGDGYFSDHVIEMRKGSDVTINGGTISGKGGATLFGTGTSTPVDEQDTLRVKSGRFTVESVDVVRTYDDWDPFGVSFAGDVDYIGQPESEIGRLGVVRIPDDAWKDNINNVTVKVGDTVYDTYEAKNNLSLYEVQEEVLITPVEDTLVFTEQNPEMPVGYDAWNVWQQYGETTTFTFNHLPLTAQQVKDGYYVERNYVIRNATNKKVVASGSGILGTDIVNVTHTWNEVGTFTFIEDLTLKDKTGAKVKSKANTFNIYVQPAVDHIEITTPPTQTTYISNIYKSGGYSLPEFAKYFEEGLVVTAYYTDGTTKDVTDLIEFNRTIPITATEVAVSFDDVIFGETHFAFQPVTVEKAYQISNTDKGGAAYAGEKMYYATEGTQLDLFNTKYYDTARYQLEGWTVTRDDNGEAVEVRRHINGGSYYFIMPDATVTIEPIWTLKKVVESIQIQTPPAKTDYYEGQEFNPAGMALRVFYTDGTWEDIKGEALRPYLHFHESIATGISRYLKLSDTAVFVQFNGLTAYQSINVTKSTGIYSIELTMDGYGYGKNVADFTVKIDTDHIRFTEAGNITDGFDLDRWNGSSSATVTSGTFDIYEYDLSIAIQLDAGYIKEFTADTVTVNGIKARSIKSMGSGKYIIGFALPNFIVSEVNLTVADPTPSTTPNDLKVVIPGGSYYTFAGTTQWTAWNEKTQTGWTLSSNGQFAAGVEYSTTLTLAPVDGFVFEDTWYELSATINGEAATITRNSNGTVSVNYSVVIPENPPSTLISNITSYVDEYVNVTVELYKRGEATPAYTEMVLGTTDNPALVVISGIEDGTYTMKVTKPYHKTYTTTITATGNTIYADVELEATSFLAVFHFGSDPIAWQEVAKGEKVIKPGDPALEGKIFTGWYTADGQLYNFNTPLTANVNLYARFDYDIDIDLSGDIHVNCVGKITYTVSGQTVTVNHSLACKVGYLNGGNYVAIAATKNGDGTYSFTAPAGVTEVVLLVKGDVSGDGRINVGDTAKLYSHVRGTAKLTDPIAIFAADVSGDGKLNVGDTAKVYSHVKSTALLTWDT